MIERLEGFPDDVVAVAYHGRVTGVDYETVLIPAVEAALERHGKAGFYCEVPDDFAGFDAAAIGQDWKVGFAHLKQWGPIAVVTDVPWVRFATHAASPFVPSGVKVFHWKDRAEARAWLAA